MEYECKDSVPKDELTTESPINEVMRKSSHQQHCVPHCTNNIERGETCGEIQYIITNLRLLQNLSPRYVLIRGNSFFRRVVQTAPVPRLYVHVRRLLRTSGL